MPTLRLICLLLVLAACSSETGTQPGLGKIALDLLRERVSAQNVEKAGASGPSPVTRAQMAGFGQPVVFVTVPRLGRGVPAFEVANNGGNRTFMGADRATVTLKDGVVVATRGLPVDLFAQGLSIAPRQLFFGDFPKTYTRKQRHLSGEATLADSDFACAIAPNDSDEVIEIFGRAHRVRQFTELCKNRTRAFKNSYWVERPSGIVWQSHQSVSKEVGHVILQQVVN